MFPEPRTRASSQVEQRREVVLRPCARFFIYAFDKRSAGLGGMAFEEGEFSVFGYVVRGEEEGFLQQLATGDVIVSAQVVQGADRLLYPAGAPAASVAPGDAAAEVVQGEELETV